MALLMSGLPARADDAAVVQASLLFKPGQKAAAGATLRLGLRLQMQPGWHVYWRNPGDAGFATEFHLQLPAGFKAGPVLWPMPQRFDKEAPIITYGYEGEVLLFCDVTLPSDWSGPALEIKGTASWMACQEQCVLGNAALQARWPGVEGGALFGRFEQRLPSTAAELGIRLKQELRGEGAERVWLLTLTFAKAPGATVGVQVFPVLGEGITLAGLKKSEATLELRLPVSAHDLRELEILVVLTGGEAPRSLLIKHTIGK